MHALLWYALKNCRTGRENTANRYGNRVSAIPAENINFQCKPVSRPVRRMELTRRDIRGSRGDALHSPHMRRVAVDDDGLTSSRSPSRSAHVTFGRHFAHTKGKHCSKRAWIGRTRKVRKLRQMRVGRMGSVTFGNKLRIRTTPASRLSFAFGHQCKR